MTRKPTDPPALYVYQYGRVEIYSTCTGWDTHHHILYLRPTFFLAPSLLSTHYFLPAVNIVRTAPLSFLLLMNSFPPTFPPPSPHVSTLSFEAAQWRNGKDKQIEERSLTFSLSIRFSPLDWFPLPWPAACVIRLQTCCKCAFHTHTLMAGVNPWNRHRKLMHCGQQKANTNPV